MLDMTSPCAASSARRQAFVAAARTRFLKNGYAATTMSAISADIGGSKTTLWSYFPSKDALFAAVIDDIVGDLGDMLSVELAADQPPAAVLARFARTLMAAFMSPDILGLHRLIVAAGPRVPSLARQFFERGPGRVSADLATYFGALTDRGLLRDGPPDLLAIRFIALCTADRQQRAALGLDDGDRAPDPAEIDRLVAFFLRGCGAV